MLNIKISSEEMEAFQKIKSMAPKAQARVVDLKLFNRIPLRRLKPADKLQGNGITIVAAFWRKPEYSALHYCALICSFGPSGVGTSP